MPACNLRFGAMATCLRRNYREIKDITLDGVAANGNAATSPSRRVVMGSVLKTLITKKPLLVHTSKFR